MSDNGFEENIDISITEYLQDNRNNTIRKILDLLDMSDISAHQKKRVRKAVLEEINSFYLASCRVLTFIQEKHGNKN